MLKMNKTKNKKSDMIKGIVKQIKLFKQGRAWGTLYGAMSII